jgi:hypothetical protein
MMPDVLKKACHACGADVSNLKRVKDATGKYYCHPCYESIARRQNAGHPSAQFVSPAEDRSDLPLIAHCASCGSQVLPDAAFCSRCGAKQNGNLSVDEEIDVTAIIGYLQKYAQTSLAMADNPDVKQECAAIKRRLEGFDRKRLMMVRELFLKNGKVDETIKLGLRQDPLGLFETGSAHVSDISSTEYPAEINDESHPKDGDAKSIDRSTAAKSRTKPLSFRLLFAGLGCLALSACLGLFFDNVSYADTISIFLLLGGVTTVLSWIVIFLSRRFSRTSGHRRNSKRRHKANNYSSRHFPVGFCICIAMILAGLVALALAGKRFINASPPTSDDIHFVNICVVVGIGLLVVGGFGLSCRCPNCHLLFTSELLGSENLGSHMEMRQETRVARHYDARGGPPLSETHYKVDLPVEITTFRHVRICKACGHVWQTTSKS